MSSKLNLRGWRPPAHVAIGVAAASGFLLPIQDVNGIPSSTLSILRYVGFFGIWICFPAQPHARRDAEIARWLVSLAAIAVLLGPVSALREDRQMVLLALNLSVSIGAALVLARRPDAVRPLFTGLVAGAALSAATVAMQAAGLPALATDSWSSHRHPGLAGSSLIASWQFAIAIIVAAFLLITSRSSLVLRVLSVVTIGLCLVAMGLCGSQGGVLGLATGAVVLVAHTWRPGSPTRILLTLGAAVLLLASVVLLASSLGAPTFSELGLTDGNALENERARVEVARAAVDSIGQHPLTGQSMESFRDENVVSPHFFPLTIGVALGIVGVVLACFPLLKLIRTTLAGPHATGLSPKLGCALVGLFTIYALVEPVGPFVSIGRLPLLVTAALACVGLSTFDGPTGAVTPKGAPSTMDRGDQPDRIDEPSGL